MSRKPSVRERHGATTAPAPSDESASEAAPGRNEPDLIEAIFGLGEDAPHAEEALTDESYVAEHPEAQSNGRLALLGRHALGLFLTESLFERFPYAGAEELERRIARVLSDRSLAGFATKRGLHRALWAAKNEHGLAGDHSLLARAVFALAGASVLDAGADAARRFARIIAEEGPLEAPPREALQELEAALLRADMPAPTCAVEATGPKHTPAFTARVASAGLVLGEGRGRSKKAALNLAIDEALMSSALASARQGRGSNSGGEEAAHAEPGSMRPLRVNLTRLDAAVTTRDPLIHWYFHPGTGDMVRVVSGMNPALEERFAGSEEHCEIRRVSMSDEYEWRVDFVKSVDNDELRAELAAALLGGKGVFRAFKDVLDKASLEDSQSWFLFRRTRVRQVSIAWLTSMGVRPRP